MFNVSNEIKENIYTEIHQHYIYITLLSGKCMDWKRKHFRFSETDLEFVRRKLEGNMEYDFKSHYPSYGKLCAFYTKNISLSILSHLWTYYVINTAALFLKPNAHGGNDLQKNTSHSAQFTHLELHTWYPYENSDRCKPADGTVPVELFTVRNVIDIIETTYLKGFMINFSQIFNCSSCTYSALL